MNKDLKCLVLFYENCIEYEIMFASELISRNYSIEIATPEGKEHRGSTGMIFKPHLKFSDVVISDYKVILIPGGDPYDMLENTEIDRILKEAHNNNLLIGAICAGLLLLAKSGILKGKNFTHGYGTYHKEFLEKFWEEANYKDNIVVVDKNVITAKPQGTIDFGLEISKILGILNAEEITKYNEYYKGIAY